MAHMECLRMESVASPSALPQSLRGRGLAARQCNIAQSPRQCRYSNVLINCTFLYDVIATGSPRKL